MPTLTDALKEAYASAPTDVVILHTLEFRHPSFTAPARVVLNNADITATLEATAPANPGAAVLFTAIAFDLELPEVSDAGAPEIVISIDNVSRELAAEIDRAMGSRNKIEVTYRPYLSTDLTAPHMDPVWHMVVREIGADNFRIRARAGFSDIINKAFPGEVYTAERFPGLIS